MIANVTEKRIVGQAPAPARTSTERTSRLLETHLRAPRWVSVDRAKLYTEAFVKYASDPLSIRRAKSYKHVLENIPIAIHPGELLVGGLTERPNGAILFPEVDAAGIKPSDEHLGPIKHAITTVATMGSYVPGLEQMPDAA